MMKRNRDLYHSQMPHKMQKSMNKSFGGDHRLLPRLLQLANEQGYSEHIDDEVLLSDLIQTYPEYLRKKKNVLKFAVEKALQLRARNFKNRESSEEDIPEDFADVDGDFSLSMGKSTSSEDTNLINKGVSGLYKNVLLEKESESSKSHPMLVNTPCSSISVPSETIDNGKTPNISTQQNSESVGVKSISRNSKKSSANKVAVSEKSTITFAQIGGMDDTLKDICKLLVHLKHPKVYRTVGIDPPRGFLLHGPPGCGKTLIAHAIAGELCLPFLQVAATKLVSGVSGESESKIRELFDEAVSNAPCILFIDEIDAIAPKREFAQREMEKRIVAQILACMDDLNMKDESSHVMVIGATNRPDSLDPALRRAGRFDREICVGIPTENARMRILQVLCKNMKLMPGFDFQWLAKNTPGYVGADLMSITREAAVSAIGRLLQKYVLHMPVENTPHLLKEEVQNAFKSTANPVTMNIDLQTAVSWLKDVPPLSENQLEELYVEIDDFKAALEVCQPSSKREGFATIPNVTWDDIGALKEARNVLQKVILLPIKCREEFEKHRLTSLSGVLLCGPKGCGKTLLAKAVANECSINFLSVKGPELLSMYVGESERAVRQCFERARNSAPCVVFFDEIDALCPRRSSNSENAVADRVVNQLLTEIDGVGFKKQVFVMGATNRPDNIDSAMLRSGRLEHILYINLPSPGDRGDILKTITKNGTQPKIVDVDLELLAMDSRCEGFSGADLTSLVRQASLEAFADYISEKEAGNQQSEFKITWSHFEMAFLKVEPTVSEKERKFFEEMASRSKRKKL